MSENFSRLQSASRKPTTPGLFRLEAWFWVSLMVTAILGLYWFATQQGGPPNRYLALLIPQVADERLFVPSGGLTREQARTRYAESLAALRAKDYEKALAGFEILEPAYPGLQDLILLHQAQAYAGQGNEWAAQQKLQALPRKKPDSPLKALALYELGLSHVRANEADKAKKVLESVRAEHPESPYATGSLYYLGLIAQKTDPRSAREHWLAYLGQCPDCRFSGEIAASLPGLLPNPTPAEHLLMGVGLASNQRDWDAALKHLQQAPFEKAWLWLAKVQLEKGAGDKARAAEAVQTLTRGLRHAENGDQAQEAIDQILKHSSTDAKATLATLSGQTLPHGQDYLLWRLAPLENGDAAARQLLSRFPKSDYAPESSWQVMWGDLKAGRREAFLQRAQTHMEQYPYARSAPRVLFWLGKTLESAQPSESRAAYQKLVKTYPADYYAFRAEHRLAALSGQRDPGWRTSASQPYPPEATDWRELTVFPAKLPEGVRRDVLDELKGIGAADEVTLLFSEAENGTAEAIPPAVQSWAYHMQGERAKGIRTMREALEARQKAAFESNAFSGADPDSTERRLLYPVYFGSQIAEQARKNGLDPFLVQSLMREESYFNEFAVSSSDARGLMQLLPTTAAEVAGWEKLSGYQTLDLFRPDVNVRLGSRYLAHLHQLFNGNAMPSVGAYNGGPNAMKRWVNNSSAFASDPDRFVEDIPYAQSRDYIKKVFGSYWNYTRLYSK